MSLPSTEIVPLSDLRKYESVLSKMAESGLYLLSMAVSALPSEPFTPT